MHYWYCILEPRCGDKVFQSFALIVESTCTSFNQDHPQVKDELAKARTTSGFNNPDRIKYVSLNWTKIEPIQAAEAERLTRLGTLSITL